MTGCTNTQHYRPQAHPGRAGFSMPRTPPLSENPPDQVPFQRVHVRVATPPTSSVQTLLTQAQSATKLTPLGIRYQNTNPPPQTMRRRKLSIFEVVDKAIELNVRKRLNMCAKLSVPNYAVEIRGGEGRASFNRLATCGDVWVCPNCSWRIMTRRRDELEEAAARAKRKGWSQVLVTVTVQHSLGESLADVLADLTQAWTSTKRGASWKRIKDRAQVQGEVTNLEITYGANGWHAHRHVMLFVQGQRTSGELRELEDAIGTRFQAMAAKLGRRVSKDYGIKVSGRAGAARYLAKWKAQDELAMSAVKEGSGVTPFGLLDLYAAGDAAAGRLFQEFAAAIKGKRRIVWSRGLRALLDMEAWEPDDAILERPKWPDLPILAWLDGRQWNQVWKQHKRLELMDVAATGSAKLVWVFLTHACGLTHDPDYERSLAERNEAMDARRATKDQVRVQQAANTRSDALAALEERL